MLLYYYFIIKENREMKIGNNTIMLPLSGGREKNTQQGPEIITTLSGVETWESSGLVSSGRSDYSVISTVTVQDLYTIPQFSNQVGLDNFPDRIAHESC
jgi:hypothetical protein